MSERTTLIFALIWIGLGLFGLIFDPDKKLIIISQFVAGFLIFIIYVRFKLIKILEDRNKHNVINQITQ